ncbi:peptidylprolyl isomerase [Lysobacter sp. K5869]|uniref:peptidylprolyl isomerase n=1 Tax=Lysobacter sp. K5869 TaxID=2820808 RepID=UPI001C0645DB|nr:peptidylprolyl isomerase [Lysobacter sp. K5869]QWP76328.1 peptidylprolyl isomerase [Lysobacter sp. K5869]
MTSIPRTALLAASLLLAAASAGAAAPAKGRTMQQVLDASQPADWRPLDPQNTVYLELERGRVVIELAPQFAPAHVANIRALAHNGYWNGLSVNRSQDNYVVQWGDPEEDAAKRKPLGAGAKDKLPAEFARKSAGLKMTVLPDADGWAKQAGFVDGFPAARDSATGSSWLTHCYGTVGAGRDMAPDSSNGSELYVVIGQSPRHLDRNITTVGRVVQGIELLSVLPRGTGALGFYEKPEQRAPIVSIRLAADVPEGQRAKLEVLRTDTPLFAELVESRRNRRDDWYLQPAGHINVCNVPLPVREKKG